jgi:hypothetical protein
MRHNLMVRRTSRPFALFFGGWRQGPSENDSAREFVLGAQRFDGARRASPSSSA